MSAVLREARQEAQKARRATDRRDDAIRRARQEGYSLRAIALETDLSHTAVAKIIARTT